MRPHRVYSPAMSAATTAALPALRRSLRILCLWMPLGALPGTEAASAQYRFGIAFGGAGMVGVVAEYRWERQGLELQAGTWRFRDLSAALCTSTGRWRSSGRTRRTGVLRAES